MAKEPKMVTVRVLRRYPRGGTFYGPGDVIQIPDYAVEGATKGPRPYCEIPEPAKAPAKAPTAPKAKSGPKDGATS